MAQQINNAWQAADGEIFITEQEALDREIILLNKKKEDLLKIWLIGKIGSELQFADKFARNIVDILPAAIVELDNIDNTTL